MSPKPHEHPAHTVPSSSSPEIARRHVLGRDSPSRPGALAPREPLPRRGRPREGQRLPLGLALSVIVHLLVLAASGYFADPARRKARPSASGMPRTAAAPDLMHVYAIAPAARRAPAIPEPVEREASESRPEPVRAELDPEYPTQTPRAGTAAIDASAGRTRAGAGAIQATSVNARLFAGHSDARLWTQPNTPSTSAAAAADIERARQRLHGRLEEVRDSIVDAHTVARRAREWTVADAGGKRWGLSPDCIRLGGLAIPRVVRSGRALCEGTRRAEYFRTWEAINAQAAFARTRDRFDERVTAIRERKDRARAKKNGARNHNGRERGRRESGGQERRAA